MSLSCRRLSYNLFQRSLISILPAAHYHRHYTDQRFPCKTENECDFGDYSIVLPEEPYILGVSHLVPRPVPEGIELPDYAKPGYLNSRESRQPVGRISLGTSSETRLREAAVLAKRVLEYAGTLVKAGVTTNDIDLAVHDFIITHNAYPSPRKYQGFPKSCCTSINNVLVHGIPDSRRLENGDIVNVDITVFLNGYHGDTSKTFLVGHVDEYGQELVELTNKALQVGIEACGPGQPFKGIGRAIHELVRGKNFCVSPQVTGHGIGNVFHKPPWILHHLNEEPGVMLPGDCFTIEPCLIQGTNPSAWVFPDGWTVSTKNAARGAQAEHMVLITESSAEVLTAQGER